jgi:hypothetical protein
MKKIILALLFTVSSLIPLQAAGSPDAYCNKHCSAKELRREIRQLRSQIRKDRARMGSPNTGDKVATVMAKHEQSLEHLKSHQSELKETRRELAQLENELKAMKEAE